MSLDRQPHLVGDLLELRPLRRDDFEALFRVAADPLLWEQHPDHDRYQASVFRAFFEQALDSGGALVALDRATGRIIGSSRYHGYDAGRSVVEIGWTFLARACWGGRYNGEMKQLMLGHAFRSVQRVVFIIGAGNWRSRRAVEKLGATLAGTRLDARGREKVEYELTPERYARAGAPTASRPDSALKGGSVSSQPKVAICLWFNGAAEEAARFYTSLIPDSAITGIQRVSPDGPAIMVTFTLAGVPFQALNGGPQYTLSEAASISVSTRDQAETDRLWNALIADGGSPSRCAWLKDRFGLSWQIVPEVLPRLLGAPDRAAAGRAMQALLAMGKVDIAALEAAFRGNP